MVYFRNQKSQFGEILEGYRIEKVGIFNTYFEYIIAIWYILWSCGNLVFSPRFVSRKIWQPCSESVLIEKNVDIQIKLVFSHRKKHRKIGS
jgi:hypothetical protein